MGYEPVEHPVEVLADVAGQAQALMRYWASKVAELEEIRYESEAAGSEQLRSEVALYERAMDRTAKLCEALARLGLEERRVQINEQLAARIGAVWRHAEDALVAFLIEHGFGDVDGFRAAMPDVLRSAYAAIETTSEEKP